MSIKREILSPSRDSRELAFVAFVLALLACVAVAGMVAREHADHELHALGTTNTISKFTGTASIGNSSATDDATTFAINSTKFTVTESSGATLAAGNLTWGAQSQRFNGATPTSDVGSVVLGSTDTSGSVITIGASGVVVTFGTGWTNRVRCMASSIGNAQVFTTSTTTSALTINCFDLAGSAQNCENLNWWCVGQ